MNAKDDEWGHNVSLQIDGHKKAINKCLHGWAPQVSAKCLGIDLEYCPKKMAFNGDVPFDLDENRYIHQFQYVFDSMLDAGNHGFGTFNACNVEDLLRIYADYKLDTAIDEDNPVLKSRNDFPPP